MRHLILALALLACRTAPKRLAADAASAPAAADQAAAQLSRPLSLYTINLPEGDHGSINIGGPRNGAQLVLDPKTWLDDGDDTDAEPDDFEGVRIVGAGADKTRLRCTSSDGITLVVWRHAGAVQLEDLTLHAGYSRGTLIGQQNVEKKIEPAFLFRALRCRFMVDPQTSGRTKWLLFGYNADWYLRDCTLNARLASEHASYRHGFARWGALWDRVTVPGSGAEGCKDRADATETAWASRDAWNIIRDCDFRDWYQLWSDRGGAAIVSQGSGANVLIERTRFFPGPAHAKAPVHQRSKCIMISAEAESYDALTGTVGTGYGTGWVIIRDVAMAASGPGPEWLSPILRVGKNGTHAQQAARGVLLERSGIWGKNYSIQVTDVPRLIVRGCNTSALRDLCTSWGMDAAVEAVIPTAQRKVPVSEGVVR